MIRHTLADEHDCLLLDLDGTVYRGSQPTHGAIEALAGVSARLLFITNNASRRATEVAAHLRALGFSAEPGDIVSSAHTAARLLASRLTPGDAVLVVGTDALAAEIRDVGLLPVRWFDDAPAAVVQGHSPNTGWSQLAEAALAIRAGALWVATNVDASFPSERGLVPGNGSMVAALGAATDARPMVAGKPGTVMLEDALARGEFHAPLLIGDRLDTDIAGANAAGLPSLVVLSGVSTAFDVIRAGPADRPTYVAEDLRALNRDGASLRVRPDAGWDIGVGRGAVTITATSAGCHGDALSIVRAAAYAVWHANFDDLGAVEVLAGDDLARRALQRWSLSG